MIPRYTLVNFLRQFGDVSGEIVEAVGRSPCGEHDDVDGETQQDAGDVPNLPEVDMQGCSGVCCFRQSKTLSKVERLKKMDVCSLDVHMCRQTIGPSPSHRQEVKDGILEYFLLVLDVSDDVL